MIRGETAGLSDSGPYGIIQPAAATNNFYDEQGAAAAYFGELEAALMQGVVGIRNEEESKTLPTLDIFPSWPMRFQQSNYKGSSGSGDSSDSGGSAQNTNTNTNSQLESEEGNKDISEQNSVTEQEMLNNNSMMMMVASNASRVGAEATNHQEPTTQDKRRMAGSATRKDGKPLDAKTLRRLAQNREAARKSRLRKKAYVQQLESSRMKLTQLEQDLQRARSQGLLLGSNAGASISPGAAMFDMEYARWLDENYRHMAELQGGLQVQLPDGDLRIIVDDCLSHYDDIFRMKSIAAKSDVFHLINGMWKSPAERCFLWIGGFKPSDLLKILMAQLDLLTEQQLLAICNLQQSSQQAEEALSQGYEQLQQALANAVASGALIEGANVGNFMGHMAMALGKIAHLEGFVQQADNLRRQTLHQLRRILTIRQAAKCFLAIGEYYSRLRALSSLWASRPRESMIIEESSCPTTANNLQMVHQPANSHFSAF